MDHRHRRALFSVAVSHHDHRSFADVEEQGCGMRDESKMMKALLFFYPLPLILALHQARVLIVQALLSDSRSRLRFQS